MTDHAFSVLQISDLHIMPIGEKMLGLDTEYYFQRILDVAHHKNKQYDLILITGDLTQNPKKECYQRIYKILRQYPGETICLPGNHDDESLMREIFNDAHVNCKKHHLLKHWQIICLSSQISGKAEGLLADSELKFVDQALSANNNLPSLIAVHHHCIPTHSAWLDTMIIKNSDQFLNLLAKHRHAKVITTGHIHQEIDEHYQSIRILSAPSTCFQFKPKSREFSVDHSMPGFRVIELYPNGDLSTEVHRLPGKLIDLDLNSRGY